MAESSRPDKKYTLRASTSKTLKGKEMEIEKKKKERKELQENRKEIEEEIENIFEIVGGQPEEHRGEEEDNTEKEIPIGEVEEMMEEEHRGQGEGPSTTRDTRTQPEKESDTNKGQMDMFNIILMEMKKQNEKMDDMKENINEKMDKQNEKMDEQNEKMDGMKENINEKMDKQNEKIDNMREELEKGMYDITVTISTEISILKDSVQDNRNAINKVKEELENKIKQIEFKFNANYQDTTVAQEKLINEVIERKTTRLSSTLQEQLLETRAEVNIHLDQIGEELIKQQNVLENYIEINNLKITENEQTMKQCKESTSNWKIELEKIRKEIGKSQTTSPQHISITCNGGINSEAGIPRYGRRSHNPIEFLTKLRNYYTRTQERGRNSNAMTIDEMLEIALEDNIGKWWLSIRDSQNTLENFEEKFLEKYWSHDIQRGLKRRIELEKFRPGGSLSRSEYFIERVLLLGQMIPRIEEADIITILSERFNEQIQDARRVQNIRTVSDFEKLLSRFDIEDENRRLQNNNFDRRGDERRSEPSRNYERNQQRENDARYNASYKYHQNTNQRNGGDGRNHPYYREDRRNRNPIDDRGYRSNRGPVYQRPDNLRSQERRYQPGYQYPDRRKYSSNEQPYGNYFNDEQRGRDGKRQEEERNPRFQRYKTMEQEAICQNISVIRNDEEHRNERERHRGNKNNTTSTNEPQNTDKTTEN